jgi:hypothetical protein
VTELRNWPILVTATQEHVLWIEAESHEKAFERARRDTWEKVSDSETLFDADMTVRIPAGEWDWQNVRDGGWCQPYGGTTHDAHVEEHNRFLYQQKRDAEKAACAAEGHPTRKTLHSGRVECDVCWIDLAGTAGGPQSTIEPVETASAVSDHA